MAYQAFTLPSYPKNIQKEDFELIKSYDTFELYQSDYSGSLLPALSEEQFLTIHSFESYAGFQTYLFDFYERDWTSMLASCTWEQFEKYWDSAVSELLEAVHVDCVSDDDGDGGGYSIVHSIYGQPYTKDCEVRANRRRNGWLAQKKAFCTEEILRAKEDKEDRELQKKIKSIQKSLLKSKKAHSKEEALKMAEKMVSLKPKVSFARVNFAFVSYDGFVEVESRPYKKRSAKTFHEKHKAMKKCAAYHKRLQKIRDITLKIPGHNRREAKRVYNSKHHTHNTPVVKPLEKTMDYVIHPAYHNAIARIVTGKNSFSFTLDIPKETHESLLMSKYPINARLLSILCTLKNH